MSCNYLDQSCHGGTPEQWKRCAARHGVECDMLDFGWTHYPNSPFGDVDICTHGVCRTHGTNDDRCKWCTPHRIPGVDDQTTIRNAELSKGGNKSEF